jgi:NDP-sugar pyrophosphorylase family protein
MLMKPMLICPSDRPAVALLGRQSPLVAFPFLGESLLAYWLSFLAREGVKQVTILAHDRPEQVRGVVGGGVRWGLDAVVLEESRELSPAQALLKYPGEAANDGHQNSICLLDHFPGLDEKNLFASYRDLFEALQNWMPRALTPDRVGIREVRPGVWAGCRSVISPMAELKAPCWIGNRVYIGPGVVAGPNTIIEDGTFVEGGAELVESCVGPSTFVGKFARITGSFAWGATLVDWQTDSVTEIADAFLLCALRQSRTGRSAGWFARLAEAWSRNKEDAALAWKHLLLNKES